MKRMICILLSLALALPALLCAAEGVTFKSSYYTLTLPAGWEIDTDDAGPEDGYEFLGGFYSPDDTGLVVFAYLEYYEELADVSLWDADDELIQEYADILLEDFSDDNPEYIGVVKAGAIPFVLVRCTDEYGDYLYADTMTNGYAVEFEVYVMDWDEHQYPLTDAYIEQFENILATFQPLN